MSLPGPTRRSPRNLPLPDLPALSAPLRREASPVPIPPLAQARQRVGRLARYADLARLLSEEVPALVDLLAACAPLPLSRFMRRAAKLRDLYRAQTLWTADAVAPVLQAGELARRVAAEAQAGELDPLGAAVLRALCARARDQADLRGAGLLADALLRGLASPA